MKKIKKIDWEAIKREYRAGQLSICEIARQFGCSDTAVRKHAKKFGWKRDLTVKVRERVRDKLVRGEVRDPTRAREDIQQPDQQTDAEIVEAMATRGAEVRLIHRRDVRAALEMVRILLAQLAQCAGSRTAIEKEIGKETQGDSNPKRRNAMLKAVSISTHAGVLRDLSTALKYLIPLERQAHDLDDEGAVADRIMVILD